MKTSFAASLAAIALAIAAPAAAGVKYTFNALTAYSGATGSFVYTAPNFITVATVIQAANLDSCVTTAGACSSVTINPSFANYALVNLNPTGNNYYFAIGAFSTFGLHNTVVFGADQAGTLLVEDTDAQVPEPAMLGLFGLGALSLIAARRRRA